MASRLIPNHRAPTAWKKGQSGNPKGRPKGSKNRRTKARLAAEAEGISPLQYMLKVLNGSSKHYSKADRKWAAERAIPYTNRRMPIAIEGGDPTKPITVVDASKLATMTEAQLKQLTTALELIDGITSEGEPPAEEGG